MGNAVALSQPIAREGVTPFPVRPVGLATRPASTARCGRLGRFSAPRRDAHRAVPNQSAHLVTREPQSPRVTLTVSTSRSSFPGAEQLSRRTGSPFAQRALPIPRLRGGGYRPSRAFRLALPRPNAIDSPTGNELDTDPPDSVRPNPLPTSCATRRHVCDQGPKQSLRGSDAGFPDTSPLLCGLRKSGVSTGRANALTIDDVAQQCKSASIANSAAKRVAGLVRFFIDFRTDGQVAFSGESPLVIIRDYIEQAASRGGTARGAIRRAL